MHAVLGVEVSLGAIADHPTMSALAAFIDECLRKGIADTPPIVSVPRATGMPLSLVQEVIWPNCRDPSFTNIRSVRIAGPLDIEIYKECLCYLIGRHEILRTTFSLVDGCPTQIIHPSAPLGFSFVDLVGCDDAEVQSDTIIRKEASRAIDPETLPLMRHVLMRITHDDYRLVRLVNLMIHDGFAGRMIEAELATLYEARLQGLEPPLPRQAPLQYADYAVWQRQVMRPDGAYFKNVINWWKNILATSTSATRLPFRRLVRRACLDPSEGVLRWTLEESAAKRLDEIARAAGTTHFIARLAAFVALIATETGNSTVLLGTFFDNRNRTDTQTIAGHFGHLVPLVFSYDATKTFEQWLQIVHRRVFETLAHSELPFDYVQEQLQMLGVNSPDHRIIFMLSRDHSEQRFGNLAVDHESRRVETMPWECWIYVDREKPENCQAMFDAGLYGRDEMQILLGLYLRLLGAAVREPELPLGKLLSMVSEKSLRWALAKSVARFHGFFETFYGRRLKAFYAESSSLKTIWRPIKRFVAQVIRGV